MFALRRFLSANQGNVGAMTAGVISVLIVAGGGAVDFVGAHQQVSDVQNAADIAVLAAAQYSGNDASERQARADRMFNTNILPNIKVTSRKLVTSGNEHTYKVTFTYKPAFLSMARLDQVNLSVTAVADVPNLPLDVVLVLDSSGSMNDDSRMVELKKAVKLFLSNFTSGASTKVSLVPFDSQVRVSNAVMSQPVAETVPNPYAAGTVCSTIADSIDRQACFDNQVTHYADCTKLKTAGVVDEEVDAYHCARKDPGFAFDSTGAYIEPGVPSDSYQFIATTDGDRHRIWRNIGDHCVSYNATTY